MRPKNLKSEIRNCKLDRSNPRFRNFGSETSLRPISNWLPPRFFYQSDKPKTIPSRFSLPAKIYHWSIINGHLSFFGGRRGAPFRELLRGSEREIELNELPLILQQWCQTDRYNEFSGLGSKLPAFLQKSDNPRSTSCQFLASFSSHRRARSVSPREPQAR